MLVFSAAPAQKTIGLTITKGQMPYITLDKNNALHIVYGRGDSIMYISSKDGRSYSFPSLVVVLPGLAASSMRGPNSSNRQWARDNGLQQSGKYFFLHKGRLRKLDQIHTGK
jgi:hypothetical protein